MYMKYKVSWHLWKHKCFFCSSSPTRNVVSVKSLSRKDLDRQAGSMHLSVVWYITLSALSLLSPVPAAQRCNFTVSHSSMTLQNAIDSLGNCKNLLIEISSGHHFITSQTNFTATTSTDKLDTVEFVARERNVTVLCDYNVPSFDYTWSFKDLSSVIITGIEFENCPRPIRIESVSNVTIRNCSFR